MEEVPRQLTNMWIHIERTRILDVSATKSTQETMSTDGVFYELCRALFFCVKDMARGWYWWLSSTERDRADRVLSLERAKPGLVQMEHGLDKRATRPRLPMHLKFWGQQIGDEDPRTHRGMAISFVMELVYWAYRRDKKSLRGWSSSDGDDERRWAYSTI